MEGPCMGEPASWKDPLRGGGGACCIGGPPEQPPKRIASIRCKPTEETDTGAMDLAKDTDPVPDPILGHLGIIPNTLQKESPRSDVNPRREKDTGATDLAEDTDPMTDPLLGLWASS